MSLKLKLLLFKTIIQAKNWWLTPIILVTWEAEIERIAVQGQRRQTVCETSPSPK
jgi:hypothetical protein